MMIEIKTPYNSTYPKVASKWLNQTLCFYSSLVQVDSFVLRNQSERKAAKPSGCEKTRPLFGEWVGVKEKALYFVFK